MANRHTRSTYIDERMLPKSARSLHSSGSQGSELSCFPFPLPSPEEKVVFKSWKSATRDTAVSTVDGEGIDDGDVGGVLSLRVIIKNNCDLR